MTSSVQDFKLVMALIFIDIATSTTVIMQPADGGVHDDQSTLANGSDDFTGVGDAIAFAPDNSDGRMIIKIRALLYEEYIEVPNYKTNIALYGEGSSVTIIIGNRSVCDGWKTLTSATIDGSDDFTGVGDAIAFAPDNNDGRMIIKIRALIYEEYIEVPNYKTNIALYGEGSSVTIIIGNRSVSDGWKTLTSATIDGSDNFTEVGDAIAFAPNNNDGQMIIQIRAGIYEEYIDLSNYKTNIVLYGEGSSVTIIIGNRSVSDGWKTLTSAIVETSGSENGGRSILEQLRSRLKEEEEEEKGPAGTLETVKIYDEFLVELVYNSKPVIADLSLIAGDLREKHAAGMAKDFGFAC
ncbi:uncharacterized protein A4U43_C07F38830 [Asparagus officinalis]|uniref:Pectinesterase catalytic domain-containing protein n=1 Tax=Asparagus officinalis TaxID=4686 RepID=A0A5P1EI44_ASPOF|nr:uncharacterized protein A4U43_C07F38830 [Asparagus officinalis]